MRTPIARFLGMRWLSLIVLSALAVGLAACGGDDKKQLALGTPQRPQVATVQEPAFESGGARGAADPSGRSNEASSSATATATGKQAGSKAGEQPAKPSYDALLQQQKTKVASRFTPCNLVTEGQAARILGGPIQQPMLAPQGPTCIYRARSGKGFVTLAVQNVRFATIRRQLRDERRILVGTRVAYCGRYGQPMLYMPLAGGRLLTVSGRCDVARAFATSAVPRLPS